MVEHQGPFDDQFTPRKLSDAGYQVPLGLEIEDWTSLNPVGPFVLILILRSAIKHYKHR